MGVDVETIIAGDGKPGMFRVVQFVGLGSIIVLIIVFIFAGKTFPKKGQTVVVHYTGMSGRSWYFYAY